MICFKSTLCIAAVAATAAFAFAVRPAQEEMAMPTPTAEHQKLMEGVGQWEGTVTLYDMPDSQPTPAKETVTAIGGFWLLSDFTSEFMGMPYHGSGHIGYDAESKKYIGTWVDSMSSYFAKMEGEYDEAKKAVVMRWKAPDMTGQIVDHREEIVGDANSRTMTFYAGEGEGKKSMKIEMKRVGKATTPAGSKK